MTGHRPESFLNGKVSLYCGDSRDVIKTLPDNSIDSIVCDPPYAHPHKAASGASIRVFSVFGALIAR